MSFTLIDYDAWERKEFLEYFQNTTIYMTVQIDISILYKRLKQRGLRLYPALIYCAAKVINENAAFRYARDHQRRIGIHDVIHPYYTVPRQGNPSLFSMKCTPFSADFSVFYEAFARDYAAAEVCGKLFADRDLPENVCGISIVPETHFTSFQFGGDPKDDFIPFVLFGKYFPEQERMLLPVSGEFSHAVNDGFHVSRFFSAFEKAANTLFGDAFSEHGSMTKMERYSK